MAPDAVGLSYSAQYDAVFSGEPVDIKTPMAKPSLDAQSQATGASRIPFSDICTVKKVSFWNWGSQTLNDIAVRGTIIGLHLAILAAPFTFSWGNLALCAVMYFVTGCLGIVIGYHRLLSHRSFSCPKWLEYTFAYCAVLGFEQHPIWWARHHRYHHRHTDTALDPHSPYQGFWWAYCGWLIHTQKLRTRAGDSSIVPDLRRDPFYRFIGKTYLLHSLGQYLVLYWLGGWPPVVWGGAVRQCATWHVTWVVNSACHVWGERPYATGELSTNNWWLSILTWGDSWHNNHHAFPFSARHGLEWYQVDVAYGVIRALQAVGLVWDVQLPSEEQKEKMAKNPAATAPAEPAVKGAFKDFPSAGNVVDKARKRSVSVAASASGAL